MALNIGLVGRGRWGANIERTLKTFDDVVLVAIDKDTTPPEGLDGVCIATPSATHFAIALPFIEKGSATFIEKPLTTLVADAEKLRDASRASGALVHVGHIHLYNPAFLKVLEILPSIGRVESILCEGMNNNPRTDSSVLWDWLPHDLSMALTIFGKEPESVEAWPIGKPLAQLAITRYMFGDAILMSVMSWLSPTKRKLTTIVGKKGSIILDDTADKKVLLRVGKEISFPEYSTDMPLTLELRAFVDAIAQKSNSIQSLETGVAIVKLITAAETAGHSVEIQSTHS